MHCNSPKRTIMQITLELFRIMNLLHLTDMRGVPPLPLTEALSDAIHQISTLRLHQMDCGGRTYAALELFHLPEQLTVNNPPNARFSRFSLRISRWDIAEPINCWRPWILQPRAGRGLAFGTLVYSTRMHHQFFSMHELSSIPIPRHHFDLFSAFQKRWSSAPCLSCTRHVHSSKTDLRDCRVSHSQRSTRYYWCREEASTREAETWDINDHPLWSCFSLTDLEVS